MEDKNYELYMQSAEYRKQFGIAFFNATNAAISMMAVLGVKDIEEAKKQIVPFRDWLLDEHVKYYVDNIAPAGMESFTIPVKLKVGLDNAKSAYESNK